jgi:hypothetical protein
MPRPPITIFLRVGGGSERLVGRPPVGRSCPAVDRGPDEWVPERHGGPKDHESGSFGGCSRVAIDSKDRRGPQEESGVRGRVGSSEE